MSRKPHFSLVTALLVFGALVFGMVIAGVVDLTPEGSADDRGAAASAVGPAMALPSFADLADQVSPAVVAIEASTFESSSSRRRNMDPFEFFFGPRRQPEDGGEEEEFRSESGGSGFVVSADGLVVTNNHVIRDADELRVRIGEDTWTATVKGTDPATDLALLQIEAEGLPTLPLGDSESVRVGDWVMAIGNPQGLTNSVTVGVVSAKGRRINISSETQSFENFIQTDAAINFGNSGGPLVNLAGEVIGINTAINFGSENIGFAVPVDVLKDILPALRDEGRVRRGYLGIEVRDLTPDAAEAFGLESTEGALVNNVLPGLPAAEGGLEAGDIILGVDGRKVRSTRELIDYVSNQGPEADVELEIYRDGKRLKKTVSLAERPADGAEAEEVEEESESEIAWLGIRYQDLTPGLRSMHSLPEDLEGVWVTQISPRSPLYGEGVRVGQVINIISKVNGEDIADVEELEKVVGEVDSGSRLRIYIRRFGRGQEIQPLFVFPEKP